MSFIVTMWHPEPTGGRRRRMSVLYVIALPLLFVGALALRVPLGLALLATLGGCLLGCLWFLREASDNRRVVDSGLAALSDGGEAGR